MKHAVIALRIAAAAQCAGLFRIAFLDGTSLGSTLFMTLGWSESAMLAVDHGVAWLGLLCGLSLLARPTRVAATIVAAWFAVVAVLTVVQGGSFGSHYAVVAHATRYLAGVTVFLACTTWPADVVQRRIEQVARWGTAATFVTHGVEALVHNPRFVDYLITAFRRIDIEISEPLARRALIAIGLQDLALAALLLAKKWRWVAGWMAFWGAVTAGSRMVHMGLPKWPATLVRSANWGLPLALFLLWSQPEKTEQPE